MDSDKPSSTSRKHRFAPKASAQRKTKRTDVPQTRKDDDNNDAEARERMLQRFSGLGNRRQRSKVENEAPVQATFTHATGMGSNAPQHGGFKVSRESDLMDLDDSTSQSIMVKESLEDDLDSDTEYREPWNYAHTYYPTTIPMRRPYSGNPDILDEAEFGEAAAKLEHVEDMKSAASKLGLLNPDETSESAELLFLQFPSSLPAIKRSATAKGKEIEDTSGPLGHKGTVAMKMGAKGASTADTFQRTRSLEEMPAGYMGKLLVYKSGKVKLRLGDTQFNVSAGSDCSFHQEVAVLNTTEKECCSVGNLDKRAIVTPDVEDILNSNANDLG